MPTNCNVNKSKEKNHIKASEILTRHVKNNNNPNIKYGHSGSKVPKRTIKTNVSSQNYNRHSCTLCTQETLQIKYIRLNTISKIYEIDIIYGCPNSLRSDVQR